MGLGTLLIRADASRDIGTGHVMRCLALAQEWLDRGGDAVFAMAESTPAIDDRLQRENCRAVTIAARRGSAGDAQRTADFARSFGCEWLVLDGYAFDIDYQRQLDKGVWKLLLVDDLATASEYAADIILNPNLSASREKYRKTGANTRVLPGTRYSLLRREFQVWSGWNRVTPPCAGRILVTLGGSTPEPVALCILEMISEVKRELNRVVFVLGASSSKSDLISRAAARLTGIVEIRQASTDMASLMAEADMAISAAGSTCWEMCFLGLPSLVIDIAENQTGEAVEMHRRGVAKYVGSGANLQADHLAAEFLLLMRSQEMRATMSGLCRHLVDGKGAQRVVSAMLHELPEDEDEITGGMSQ